MMELNITVEESGITKLRGKNVVDFEFICYSITKLQFQIVLNGILVQFKIGIQVMIFYNSDFR